MNGQLRIVMLIIGLMLIVIGTTWMARTQSYWGGGPIVIIGGFLFGMGTKDKKD